MIMSKQSSRRTWKLLAAVSAIVAVMTMAIASPAEAWTPPKLTFPLNGSQVPGGGDPDGRGWARLEFHPVKESVCFRVNWSRLDGVVTAMHIHEAPAGEIGGHFIDLFNDEHFSGHRNVLQACVKVQSHDPNHPPRQLIRQVINHPERFYLNIHSSAFPDGAIRGQLNG